MLAKEILDGIESDFRDLELASEPEDRAEVLGSIRGGFDELRVLTEGMRAVRDNGAPLN